MSVTPDVGVAQTTAGEQEMKPRSQTTARELMREVGSVLRMSEAAARMLEEFIDGFGRSHPGALGSADTRLVVGVPVTRILEVADDEDARLIVMGSRGRTGLVRILLGSCAENVVRLAEMPVVIVKDESRPKKEKRKRKKKSKKGKKGK